MVSILKKPSGRRGLAKGMGKAAGLSAAYALAGLAKPVRAPRSSATPPKSRGR